MRHLVGLALLVSTVGAACAPAELSPDQIVAAFIADSQDDARTMHMEWQGTIHTSQQTEGEGPTESDASIAATAEFSGADYEAVLTTTTTGGDFVAPTTIVSYARVAGVDFTRYEGGDWQSIAFGGAIPLSFDPLTGLTAADLTYDAPETLDGRAVHKLRVNDPAGALRRTLFPESAVVEFHLVDSSEAGYSIYVDSQGIPVGAHLRADVSVQTSDANSTAPEIQYEFTSEYEFSDWGAEIIIIAPSITGGGGIEDKPPFVP